MMMKITCHHHKSTLVGSFNDAYFDGENCLDLIFVCRNKIQIKAHKLVLASVSEFLKSVIWDSNQDTVYISLPDVSHKVMKLLLNYLYCGVTKLNQVELVEMKNVLTLLGICLPSAVVTTAGDSTSSAVVEVKKEMPDGGVYSRNSPSETSTLSESERIPVIASSSGNRSLSSPPPLVHFNSQREGDMNKISPGPSTAFGNGPAFTIEALNVKMEGMDDDSFMSPENYLMDSSQVSELSGTTSDALQGFDMRKIETLTWINAKCPKCGHITPLEGGYDQNNFNCGNCGAQICQSSSKLSEMSKCEECGCTFDSIDKLLKHRTSHYSPARQFHCSLCDRYYKTKKNLRDHTRNVHDRPRYHCDECDKVFKVKALLTYHKSLAHSNGLFTTVLLPSAE